MSMIAQRARYRRLSALALGTSFVMAVVFVVSLQWYFTRVDRYDDFSSLAEIVGTNASAALIFDDARTARETLASLVHSPELIEAGLFRRDGTPLATYHRSAPDDSDARMKAVLDGAGPAFTLREMRVIAPIEVNGEIVGRVVLRVSLNDVYAEAAPSASPPWSCAACGAASHKPNRRSARPTTACAASPTTCRWCCSN
ncbi:MAG: hypothetical protein HZC24_00890 [Rhodocyclales bacterium]|nr:hypothetical protein [Rhodocyclales bacterium]